MLKEQPIDNYLGNPSKNLSSWVFKKLLSIGNVEWVAFIWDKIQLFESCPNFEIHKS